MFFPSLCPLLDDDADVVQDSEFEWLKDMNVAGGAKSEKEATAAPDTLSGPLYEKKDGKIFLEIQSSAQPRTRDITWISAVIVFGSAALILILYVFSGDIIRSTFAFFDQEKPVPQPEVLPEVLRGEHVNLISLQNVRQYFVTNEKIG